MPSLNRWTGIGSLGRDVEVKYLPNGTTVATFSMACNETWKDSNGEKKERVEWVNVVAYGRLAEIAGEYLIKGMSVYIEGPLRTRKWDDKEGNKRYTTEIIAKGLQMLGGKRKEKTDDETPVQNDQEIPF